MKSSVFLFLSIYFVLFVPTIEAIEKVPICIKVKELMPNGYTNIFHYNASNMLVGSSSIDPLRGRVSGQRYEHETTKTNKIERILKVTTEDEIFSRKQKVYSLDGVLLKEGDITPNGEFTGETTYEHYRYDEIGRQSDVSSNLNICERLYYRDAYLIRNDRFFDGLASQSFLYSYTNGLVLKKFIYNNNERLRNEDFLKLRNQDLYSIVRYYYKNRRLIRETTEDNKMFVYEIEKYHYTNDALVRKDYFNPPRTLKSRTFYYRDRHGNVTNNTFYDAEYGGSQVILTWYKYFY